MTILEKMIDILIMERENALRQLRNATPGDCENKAQNKFNEISTIIYSFLAYKEKYGDKKEQHA